MTGWGFGAHRLLGLLALVPLVVMAYAFDGQRRRRLIERIGGAQMIARMIASTSPGRRRLKAILTAAALTLLLAALARPEMPGRARLTESRGLDLVIALDLSRSMLARDVYPSRLARAKLELGHLLDMLKGDRVGVVVFAGETMSYPLTVDYEAAKLFWRDLEPDDMPVGGTDLGRAIGAATDLLVRARKPDAKRRPAQLILLLTDGEDTEGKGIEAARAAKEAGLKLFTLGIGSTDRPYVQLYDPDGHESGTVTDESGQPVRVGLDEGALKQMAALTGGDYLHIDSAHFGVERVQQQIAGLERTEEEARFEREPEDVGRFLLVPAFVLLVAEACVRERRRRKPVAAEGSPSPSAPRSREASRKTLQAALLLCLPLLGGFDLFLRRDPNVEEGNRLLQTGKAEEALKAYDRATEALPEEPIVRFDRGAALYQLGKFPEAQKEFQRAAEGHDPQLKADSYYNMGNSLLKQERWKEAIDAYKHTLGLRPEDRRAKWNLELALRRLREPPPQQQQQQQQQQQDPKSQPKSAESPQKPPPQDPKAGAEEKKPAPREAPRDIDKQDAEAVLDALERVEPTVQKDLAHRRAGSRRPTKDW